MMKDIDREEAQGRRGMAWSVGWLSLIVICGILLAAGGVVSVAVVQDSKPIANIYGNFKSIS